MIIFRCVLSVFFLFTLNSCTSIGEKTSKGVGIGAAAGGVAGAVIGHQRGERGRGAAVGAAAGAVVGGAIGRKMDKQAEELAEVAETRRTDEGIVTRLKGDLLFDTGSAALKDDAKRNLNKIGDILSKYPENRVMIFGHTDSTGSLELNNRLSLQRAESVRRHLVQRGVPAASLRIFGKGPSEPVASNDTPEGRALNRRVDMQINMVEDKQ